MRLFNRHAVAAKKSLSLDQHGLFFLLTTMTALLGFLLATMGAGLAGSAVVYKNWQLHQNTQITVTLLGDTSALDVQTLIQTLQTQPFITDVTEAPAAAVKALLLPLLGDVSAIPLPKLVQVTLQTAPEATLTQNILALEESVLLEVPTAILDDNRALLTRVGQLVSFGQWALMLVTVLVLLVMAGLVSLTVRAGIRTQNTSVGVLKILGGTDNFVANLVVRQVVKRAVYGWLIAIISFAVVFTCVSMLTPLLYSWLGEPMVWGAAVGTAGSLVMMTSIIAKFTAMKGVKNHG